MLQRLSIVLRIINSDDLVIIDLYGNYCKDTLLFIEDKFPWASVPPTVHEYLWHSAEIIERNRCHGLLNHSEEGAESSHKEVKKHKERLARKTSTPDNLLDTAKNLWVKTSPNVHAFKRQLYCSYCSKQDAGHTKRGCPHRKEEASKNEDDLIYDSLTVEVFEDEEKVVTDEDFDIYDSMDFE